MPAFLYLFYIERQQDIWEDWQRKERERQQDLQLLSKVTSIDRGELSERELVIQLLKNGFDENKIWHDLYIKKYDGNFTQVDIVIATNAGLIAVEVKDYAGWIYGKYYERYWMQVLSYGKFKNKFYNPFMQNQKHIESIRKLLYNQKIRIFNLVVFSGNCRLENISGIPADCFLTTQQNFIDVVKTIANDSKFSNSRLFLNYRDEISMINKFKKAHSYGNDYNIVQEHIRHVQEIKEKYNAS